ncbi:hypothetical protein MMC09_003633 [Bachmanniomyces sp. S44760]|nr:hypothetical protein [Bachmanniomyces sp. S44760]
MSFQPSSALFSNDVSQAHDLIFQGVSLEPNDLGHVLALQAACCRGNISIVDLLLSNANALSAVQANQTGAQAQTQTQIQSWGSLNLIASLGRYHNAILASIFSDHANLVDFLLSKWGADANLSSPVGVVYPEHVLVAQPALLESPELLRQLLVHGGLHFAGPLSQRREDSFIRVLDLAMGRGNVNTIDILLEYKREGRLEEDDLRSRYWQILELAALKGDEEVVAAGLKMEEAVKSNEGTATNPTQQRRELFTSLFRQFESNLGADYSNDKATEQLTYYITQAEYYTIYSDGSTPLQVASFVKNPALVKTLISHGASVNAIGTHGTALQGASYQEQYTGLEVVPILLDAGADPNQVGGEMGSALVAAAFTGSVDSCRMLLDIGANVDLWSQPFGTALCAAAYRSKINVVEYLIERGADLDAGGSEHGTPLQAAAWGSSSGRRVDILRLLVVAGAKVGTHSVSATSNRGTKVLRSALHLAIERGDEDAVLFLVEAGADVNDLDEEKGTPLLATLSKRRGMSQLLIAMGANVNARGGKYDNAVQAAALHSLDLIRLLEAKGADLKTQGGEFHNALQAASYNADPDIMLHLLQNGFDVNIEGGRFGTPLQALAAPYRPNENKQKALELLLAHGANVNASGGEYGSPLLAAVAYQNISFISVLLDHGADVKIQGGIYHSVLQAAASRDQNAEGDISILNLLLKNGAAINAPGGKYGCALQAAACGSENWFGVSRSDRVSFLLPLGADVNLEGGKHGTALGAAVYKRDLDTARELIKNGADMTRLEETKRIWLQTMVKRGEIDRES